MACLHMQKLCLQRLGSPASSIIRKGLLSTTNAVQSNVTPGGGLHIDQQRLTVPPSHLQRPSLPLVTSRKLPFPVKDAQAKQAWLETLETAENKKLGMVDLHPEIFGAFPRIDLLWRNVHWQNMYKKIDFTKVKTRAEMRGGGRKPWPQKGTGRARHGSIRSPLWRGGGKSHGPRGPTSYFFMLPDSMRLAGLKTALTVKYSQDNLHIVDSLDIPSDEPEYLENIIESKGWGLSVLFIDHTDIVPRNIAMATDQIDPYNIMPVYGLNVYSILKHETLVLSLAALEQLEERMLFHLHKQDFRDKKFNRFSTQV